MCDRVTVEIYIIDIIIVATAVVAVVAVVCYLQRHNLISVCTIQTHTHTHYDVYVRAKERACFIMPNGILFMFYVIFFLLLRLHCSIVAGGMCVYVCAYGYLVCCLLLWQCLNE